ncbi:kinase isozyme 4, mitochondrial [Seminavis robusta]|uniref:Protein-serine/threonine kinase n=1 Tax=Seminavis robusta TaxID=568900 RepID=A0A9N8E2Q7_9STRA|nr:kinase isozyme 4, mitochondrial [Seminavis robusta]|eukprot:Sro496_g154600.1 kinase isozyme 4, mitochondrial (568) ;mRNA; f:23749-25547
MSASTILTAAAKTASKTTVRRAARRSMATSTRAVKKSAVGVIVQATNMPLSNIMPSFGSPLPSSGTSSSSRNNSRKELQKLSGLASAMSRSSLDDDTSPSSSRRSLIDETGQVNMFELQRLASLSPTSLKLGDMYKYAASADLEQRLRNAQFLHRELPIRLAQRAYDLLSLPHGLSSESTPIRQVAQMYVQYIQQFLEFPFPQTNSQEEGFTEQLQGMVMDRTSIPTTIAQGLMEWLDDDRREDFELGRQQEMEDALVRFFTARVGLRFLAEHHILSSPSQRGGDKLREAQTAISPSEVGAKDRGCIQHDCNPVQECEKVAQEVARQTYDCYGICPEIEIVDRQSDNAQVFTYVPHHLHYMLAELLKNSCRVSVERYMEQGGSNSTTAKISPVRVVIVKGANEVTIKVSDEGGGIPRSTMARIFKFTHSTSRQEYEGNTDFGTVEAGIKHMRGFGLPLARIYARYFGGELTLKSMEGYGLDAYLYLPRLGDACENLPRRVIASPGEQVSLPAPKRINKSGTRAFSTLAPNRQSANEPWVVESDELDEAGWEESKTRRVLQILHSRAL